MDFYQKSSQPSSARRKLHALDAAPKENLRKQERSISFSEPHLGQSKGGRVAIFIFEEKLRRRCSSTLKMFSRRRASVYRLVSHLRAKHSETRSHPGTSFSERSSSISWNLNTLSAKETGSSILIFGLKNSKSGSMIWGSMQRSSVCDNTRKTSFRTIRNGQLMWSTRRHSDGKSSSASPIERILILKIIWNKAGKIYNTRIRIRMRNSSPMSSSRHLDSLA